MMKKSGKQSNFMTTDALIRQAEAGWEAVQQIVYVPQNDGEYDRLVAVLDTLLDQVGEDETHPLASLLHVIGALIEQYEDAHVPEIDDSPA
jgi:HTH-type transcriptional regulator / antitoxin HigA